jgi:hypothetical protein
MLITACAATGTTSTTACDRACLKGNIDRYLAAMVTHDPGRLKLATHARFTEDTVEKKPEESELRKSATALRPFRQDFLDVHADVATEDRRRQAR